MAFPLHRYAYALHEEHACTRIPIATPCLLPISPTKRAASRPMPPKSQPQQVDETVRGGEITVLLAFLGPRLRAATYRYRRILYVWRGDCIRAEWSPSQTPAMFHGTAIRWAPSGALTSPAKRLPASNWVGCIWFKSYLKMIQWFGSTQTSEDFLAMKLWELQPLRPIKIMVIVDQFMVGCYLLP